MHKKIFFLLFVVIVGNAALAQTLINGFVKDAITGEKLIGANVQLLGSAKGSVTDNNGYFTLKVETPATLKVSYIGYAPQSISIVTNKDTLIIIALNAANELTEVQITANRVRKPNVAHLSSKELMNIPSLSGKPDVLKAVQLLPGIKGQSEGSSLLLVRGGNPGENLYLLDNVPLIYVNHLGGFMSVFNPDMINNIDIYKGSFPARYGSKLSSVVDITQKEGNTSRRKSSYSIGITDLSVTMEGPLRKKVNYMFTGRKTLFDLLSIAASSIGEGNSFIMAYGFHDLNGKISWRPDNKNSYHFNIYQGDDYMNFWSKKKDFGSNGKNRIKYVWGNWLVSTNWKHVVNNKLFTEQVLSFTRYRLSDKQKFTFTSDNGKETMQNSYLSTVQDFSLQSVWKYFLSNAWVLNFGAKTSLLYHLPNYSLRSNELVQKNREYILTNETALYADNKIELNSQLTVNAGLRIANFNAKSFNTLALEPRANIEIELNPSTSFNAGYSRVNQFSHLLFTPGAIMSNEVWIPSGANIKPSTSNQYNLGCVYNSQNGSFSAEAAIYYKTMRNLVTYKERYLNLKGDNNWSTKVETGGKGDAYGLELMLRKNTGKWTGFASYSYSKATRQYAGINSNRKYVYEYDRPHTASLSVNHSFSGKVMLNLTWVYQTGIPYTPVIGRQLTQSLEPDEEGNYIYYEAFIYGERNSARLKDYHRLDIGLTLNRLTAENTIQSKWNFSIYNAYNRKNPVYYYYNTNATGEIINPATSGTKYKPFNMYQMALFTLIPVVSYTKYFGVVTTEKKSLKRRLHNWLYYED